MVHVAGQTKSALITSAAQILALSWCLSLFVYWGFSRTGMTWGLAVIDASLAIHFFNQSRKSLFPVPLFFIHALLVLYYFGISIFDIQTWKVVVIFVNRLFELSVLYVIGCSLFRLQARHSAG